jgi:hypothetical protein
MAATRNVPGVIQNAKDPHLALSIRTLEDGLSSA